MDKRTNRFLDKVVRKVLNSDEADDKRSSIAECAQNMYLNPDYDPFEMLQFQLMALSYREMLGISSSGESSGS